MAESDDSTVLLGNLRSRSPIVREFLSEFLGTFLLVLICDCSIGVQLLSKRHDVDLVAIGLSTGVALMFVALLGAKVSGGHVNPVVTLSLATLGKFPWKKVPHYFAAQYLGGLLGTAVAYLNHHQAITVFDGGVRSAFFNQTSTGAILTSHPAVHISIGPVILNEILATGFLQFGIMCLIDEKNLNTPKSLIPISLALLLAVCIIAFGLNAGPALNPARDLAARILAFAVGYGPEVFNPNGGLYWIIGGLIGPHIGGIIGAWIYYLFIELHLPCNAKHNEYEVENIALTKRTPDVL